MAAPLRTCLAAILSLACGEREAVNRDAVADANALYGDFIAVLKRRYWSEPGEFETCVLEPETIVYSDEREMEDPGRWKMFVGRFPALRRDTYDRFWSRSEPARPVAPVDRGVMRLHVLTTAEVAELEKLVDAEFVRGEYWSNFRARYGNAIRIGFSAPGFSDDGQQALIYYEAIFDWLAAWGSYCLLEREGDRWVIAKQHCVWQS